MGRRQRRREAHGDPDRGAPAVQASEYGDAEGNELVLRDRLSPGARVQYAELLRGGLDREDARQRATELLFERLAISWTIVGLKLTAQRELLARYRMASTEERQFVRQAIRTHAGEHFPELEAP